MADPFTTEPLNDNPNPIGDDPKTLDELYRAGLPDETETPTNEWEEPLSKVIENQDSLTKLVTELAGTVRDYINQPRQVERIVERPVEKPEPPEEPKWRSQIKPEQAELLDQAIEDRASRKLQEFKERELGPVVQYLLSTQERLIERELTDKYDDEDFGFGVLKDEAKAYRQSTGFNTDLESAYIRVVFDRMQKALAGARQLQKKRAKQDKTDDAVDEGGTAPAKPEDSDELDAEERRAARAFFGGIDPKTNKYRSQSELDTMWLEHKRGAKRDELPD